LQAAVPLDLPFGFSFGGANSSFAPYCLSTLFYRYPFGLWPPQPGLALQRGRSIVLTASSPSRTFSWRLVRPEDSAATEPTGSRERPLRSDCPVDIPRISSPSLRAEHPCDEDALAGWTPARLVTPTHAPLRAFVVGERELSRLAGPVKFAVHFSLPVFREARARQRRAAQS